MYVFKQAGSRVYRARYRLSNGRKLYDVPLHTHIKEVAEAKARKLVEEQERELAGLLAPKPLRDAATRPLDDHLVDYVADLIARERSKAHAVHVRCRLRRLLKECRWRLVRDVTADSFVAWRAAHPELSAKTGNEYIGHAKAFLTWLEKQGRQTHNPLLVVEKAKTVGKETFKRRALPIDPLVGLIEQSGPRGFAYAMAGLTGLRRGELKRLLWSDVHLNKDGPYIHVRKEISKNGKEAILPLVPLLADQLRRRLKEKPAPSQALIPEGIPSVSTLRKDLSRCGIPFEDERGWRLDFHALRHSFASALAGAGVSELTRMKLARHSALRQTDQYTDPLSVPLFAEMGKLSALLPATIGGGGRAAHQAGSGRDAVGASAPGGRAPPRSLPSLVASLSTGKRRNKAVADVQLSKTVDGSEVVRAEREKADLGTVVPSGETIQKMPKGGLEPPCC